MTGDTTPQTSSVDAVLREAQGVSLSPRRRRPHPQPATTEPTPRPAAQTRTAPPAELPSRPEPQADPAPARPARKPTRTPRRGSGKPAKKSITFTIPQDLHLQINAFKQETGRTSENLLLRALATLAPHAAQAVADDLAETDPEALQLAQTATGGFTVTPEPRRTGTRSQFGMRLSPDDIDRIDDLAESAGATDRGHLVTLALQAYLGRHDSPGA